MELRTPHISEITAIKRTSINSICAIYETGLLVELTGAEIISFCVVVGCQEQKMLDVVAKMLSLFISFQAFMIVLVTLFLRWKECTLVVRMEISGFFWHAK